MRSMQRIAGIDFTSSPSRRKPVTVALGRLQGSTVTLERVEAHLPLQEADFDGLGDPWLGVDGEIDGRSVDMVTGREKGQS